MDLQCTSNFQKSIWCCQALCLFSLCAPLSGRVWTTTTTRPLLWNKQGNVWKKHLYKSIMRTHSKRLQMSSCLWPIESYDFTVFDLKSITYNESAKRRRQEILLKHLVSFLLTTLNTLDVNYSTRITLNLRQSKSPLHLMWRITDWKGGIW